MPSVDDFFSAADSIKAGDNQLKSISALMVEEAQLVAAIETQEAILADLNLRLNSVTREKLPSAMSEAGVAEFKCSETGTIAKLAFAVDGALGSDEEERERKLDLLIAAGADSIVKMMVTVPFGKGDYADATALSKDLEEKGVTHTMGRNIHHQTLKAWVKEQMEAGAKLPLDEVGMWYGQIAKIKRLKVEG